MQQLGSNVFTYGSLMFAPVWLSVCSQTYVTLPATLQGYRRYSVQGESYPALVPEEGASVTGLVYRNVTADDCRRLDQFEGAEYVGRSAAVTSSEETINAMFYEFVALDKLLRQDWSVAQFEEKGLQTFLSRHVGDFLATGERQPHSR